MEDLLDKAEKWINEMVALEERMSESGLFEDIENNPDEIPDKILKFFDTETLEHLETDVKVFHAMIGAQLEKRKNKNMLKAINYTIQTNPKTYLYSDLYDFLFDSDENNRDLYLMKITRNLNKMKDDILETEKVTEKKINTEKKR